MKKFLASQFDSESPEYYPEDFQGAAPGDGVIYISSDDDMECASRASVDDLESLTDDDEMCGPMCGKTTGLAINFSGYSNPLSFRKARSHSRNDSQACIRAGTDVRRWVL